MPTKFLQFLVGSLVVGSGLQAQSEDLSSLLSKIAKRYATLTDYVIQIETYHSAHALTADTLNLHAPPNRITLARSGLKLRYEVSGPLTSLTWITDGERTWAYKPDLKEYTIGDAVPWKDVPTREDGLQHLDWEYVSKFRALVGFVQRATLIKGSIPPSKECPTATALIKLDIGHPKQPATEILRVDVDSGLVCSSEQEVTHLSRGTPAIYNTTTHWSYHQLKPPTDENLFRFAPPKSAKLVKQFRRPSVQ